MKILAHATRAAALLVAAAAALPIHAGYDIDFGASIRNGDVKDLYLAISSRYFERDRPTVERWSTRYDNPDDLAICLFIAKRSRKTPEMVSDLRRTGLSWWEISLRLGVPPDAWFVPTKRDPGPPYGNAYGYWKKHRRQPSAMRLTDQDMRNLIAVRIIHDYYGTSVDVAMEWRASGRDLPSLMADEYGRRHGAHRGRHRSDDDESDDDSDDQGSDDHHKKTGRGHGKHKHG